MDLPEGPPFLLGPPLPRVLMWNGLFWVQPRGPGDAVLGAAGLRTEMRGVWRPGPSAPGPAPQATAPAVPTCTESGERAGAPCGQDRTGSGAALPASHPYVIVTFDLSQQPIGQGLGGPGHAHAGPLPSIGIAEEAQGGEDGEASAQETVRPPPPGGVSFYFYSPHSNSGTFLMAEGDEGGYWVAPGTLAPWASLVGPQPRCPCVRGNCGVHFAQEKGYTAHCPQPTCPPSEEVAGA